MPHDFQYDTGHFPSTANYGASLIKTDRAQFLETPTREPIQTDILLHAILSSKNLQGGKFSGLSSPGWLNNRFRCLWMVIFPQSVIIVKFTPDHSIHNPALSAIRLIGDVSLGGVRGFKYFLSNYVRAISESSIATIVRHNAIRPTDNNYLPFPDHDAYSSQSKIGRSYSQI